MELIKYKTYDEERALYGSNNVQVIDCAFDGPADGESPLKESSHVIVERCFFNLRYPFWHVYDLQISDSEMTQLCRAALWYSDHIEISNTRMHGIKALRECNDVTLRECDILSPEFGWFAQDVRMEHCTAESEYFFMRSENLNFSHVQQKGKYSFQYLKNAVFEDCEFETKDAFWHAQNITVRNSVIRGEFLAWYSDHLTLENCKIIGTQPFCYCTNLKLTNCEMIDTDLCFEKSDVDAVITTPVISIKNPNSGRILVPAVDDIIRDDPDANGEIVLLQCETEIE